MPEVSEVKMMKEHAEQKGVIGKRIKNWKLADRRKENGQYDERGPDLGPFVFNTKVSRIQLRGKKFIIEVESEGISSNIFTSNTFRRNISCNMLQFQSWSNSFLCSN